MNLFDFIKETPDKYLQKKVEQDKRLYLPPDLVPTGKKKQIQKVGRTFAYLPTFPVFSTMSRALMRDIRSAPMGLSAWGHGKRMFQPFIVTDYAVKASDAWEEVWCPRNTSKESYQQPPASMISIVSLSWFISSVPPNGSLTKTGRLQMSNHVYRIGNVSPFAISPSVGHRARVQTHA